MNIRALAIITALAVPPVAMADDQTKTGQQTGEQPAQPTGQQTGDTKAAKLNDADTKIVSHVHYVNQTEIDLGKAAQKSGSASVKSYANMLVNDHQTLDKDLTSFAKSHKLAMIPAYRPATDADKQEHKDLTTQVSRLKTLKGAEFDREFLNLAVTTHDKVLTQIDTHIGAASNPDLQNMLKSIKPVLQRHADQARDLQKNVQAQLESQPSQQPGSR